jgi:hypothetical protein
MLAHRVSGSLFISCCSPLRRFSFLSFFFPFLFHFPLSLSLSFFFLVSLLTSFYFFSPFSFSYVCFFLFSPLLFIVAYEIVFLFFLVFFFFFLVFLLQRTARPSCSALNPGLCTVRQWMCTPMPSAHGSC